MSGRDLRKEGGNPRINARGVATKSQPPARAGPGKRKSETASEEKIARRKKQGVG